MPNNTFREEELREDFANKFAIKVTPNNAEDETKAFLLEKFWKETTLNDMADYWLSKIHDSQRRLVEEIVKNIEEQISQAHRIQSPRLDDTIMGLESAIVIINQTLK